jgi:hypothetical protein
MKRTQTTTQVMLAVFYIPAVAKAFFDAEASVNANTGKRHPDAKLYTLNVGHQGNQTEVWAVSAREAIAWGVRRFGARATVSVLEAA